MCRKELRSAGVRCKTGKKKSPSVKWKSRRSVGPEERRTLTGQGKEALIRQGLWKVLRMEGREDILRTGDENTRQGREV